MAGRAPTCAYILCSEPLPAGSRSDRRYCCPAHKAAAHRWRLHFSEAAEVYAHVLHGLDDERVVRCPVCGKRFAHGHGHRRDAVYCGHACRQAAFRSRHRVLHEVRVAVTEDREVTDPRTATGR